MSKSGPPNDSAIPQHVQRIVDEFQLAWELCQGKAEVEITQYLPPADDRDRLLACFRLVAVDLRQRWRRGQAVLLEEYVRRYPELRNAPSLFVELLHEEYLVRKEGDPSVEVQSYQVRFPEHYRALVRMEQPLEQESDDLNTLRTPTFPGPEKPVHPATEVFNHQAAVGSGSTVGSRGNYKLVEPLGRGQFGEVWRAEAPGGVEVALKIIRFPVGHKMTQLELQSLEVMKKLRHSFLLQVQAYWIDNDELFVAMELGDETLQDLAKRYAALQERIPSRKLISYFVEAGEAVDFLHSQHVLHRDIKPANILLVSGHVKVADFGISRAVSDNQTVTATTMGTPLYMAPEVWQGKASPRSDQYSLAMTYAELRMGRAPYSAKSYYEVMNQHLKQAPDLDLLEPRERQVVRKALAKEPKDRYESCTEFATALREALEPRQGDLRPPGTLTRRLVIGTVVVVLSLVAGYVFRPEISEVPLIELAPASLRATAGQSASVDVTVVGGRLDPSAIELLVPKGITYTRRVDGPRVIFSLSIGHEVPPTTYAARVVGDGLPPDKYVISLDVQPAPVVQVEGFELSEEVREVGGKMFATRIHCQRGAQQYDFVLIPRESTDDPATFYILRTKATNAMFARFVAETSTTASLNEASRNWYLGGRAGTEDRPAEDHPDLPVYGVHIEDAEAFAKWLGGRLPTAKQWDKAAGKGEAAHEGPFNVPLNQLTAELVAFNRTSEGPAPVATASADVSPHYCTDMAGNGYEYTRTAASGRDADPVSELQYEEVVVRGASYRDPRPWTFDSPSYPQYYDEVSREVSFRVVVENSRW